MLIKLTYWGSTALKWKEKWGIEACESRLGDVVWHSVWTFCHSNRRKGRFIMSSYSLIFIHLQSMKNLTEIGFFSNRMTWYETNEACLWTFLDTFGFHLPFYQGRSEVRVDGVPWAVKDSGPNMAPGLGMIFWAFRPHVSERWQLLFLCPQREKLIHELEEERRLRLESEKRLREVTEESELGRAQMVSLQQKFSR